MLLAIFTVAFVIFLTTEIAEETIAEYLASSTEVKKVQSYYAAKACMQLSLLRIKGYQQATEALGSVIPDASMLDLIWKFPLSWPPAIPKDLNSFDSSTIKKTVAGSSFKNQFLSSITPEGGRIDINDLGSPSRTLREKTRKQILERLQSRVLHGDDDFSDRYSNFNFEELINNITDWIDADSSGLNGGDERSLYSDLRNEFLPPNRPFKTVEELHMIDGMTDEIYEVLAPEITLFGVKGINVNQAEKDVLLSLFTRIDPSTADEIATEILKRRNNPELGGPFKDEKDFLGFLSGFIDAEKFNEENVPLFYGAELNFKVSCIGQAGNLAREIQAIVYNPLSVQQRLQEALEKDKVEENGGRNLAEECKDKPEGDEKYRCLCQLAGNDSEIKRCVDSKKQEAEQAKNQDQSQGRNQIQRGPPKIIYWQVN